jgi:carbamoyltransferase
MGCEIDTLVVENCLLHKAQQDPALKRDYKNAFELD